MLGVMVTLIVSIKSGHPGVEVTRVEDLDALIDESGAEARRLGRLNVITMAAPNGDGLSLVVGGDETVVAFSYGHGDPPYYASAGASQEDHPVLTAFLGLEHHTEFPRREVLPISAGRQAAREFMLTGRRPASVQWEEV